MKIEIADYNAVCPPDRRVQTVEMSTEEFEVRTSSLQPGFIVFKQSYQIDSLESPDVICFINKIDGEITDSYRERLNRSLRTLEEWKQKELSRHRVELKKIEEQIVEARKLLGVPDESLSCM